MTKCVNFVYFLIFEINCNLPPAFPHLSAMSLTCTHRQVARSRGNLVPVGGPTSTPLEDASSKPKATWSLLMNRTLINLYLDELEKKQGANNGLKSQQWTTIQMKMLEEFPEDELTSQQIQSNWGFQKRKWRAYRDLRERSGF